MFKILLALFIAYVSKPPLHEAVIRSFNPTHFSFTAVLTIVGGTVGGYITFAGAHRLLDAGVTGEQNLDKVNKGALAAIGITSVMRILLFMAALGVINAGGKLNPDNPAASVFQLAAGRFGYTLFGLEIMTAGISSVVGSAYTSVSFIKSFHPLISKYNRQIIIGFILPLSLGIMLVAAYRSKIISNYKQPLWLTLLGTLVVGIMTWMSAGAILQMMER
jgi:Mn2+/Fe2+ NRAMP family transporter